MEDNNSDEDDGIVCGDHIAKIVAQKLIIMENIDVIQQMCLSNYRPNNKRCKFKKGLMKILRERFVLTRRVVKNLTNKFHVTGCVADYANEETHFGRHKLITKDSIRKSFNKAGQHLSDYYHLATPASLHFYLETEKVEISRNSVKSILNNELHAKVVTVRPCLGVRTPRLNNNDWFKDAPMKLVHNPEEDDIKQNGNKIIIWKGINPPTASINRTYKVRDGGERVNFVTHGWTDERYSYFPKVVETEIFCKCEKCVAMKVLLELGKERRQVGYNCYVYDLDHGVNIADDVTNENVTNYEFMLTKRRKTLWGEECSVGSDGGMSLCEASDLSIDESEYESVGFSVGTVSEASDYEAETSSTIISSSSVSEEGEEEWDSVVTMQNKIND
jgi:hypothetical protein